MQNKNKRTNPMNIATDLLASVLVGLAGGFYLDKWLDTKPLFIIICLMIGIAAGLKMVLRK